MRQARTFVPDASFQDVLDTQEQPSRLERVRMTAPDDPELLDPKREIHLIVGSRMNMVFDGHARCPNCEGNLQIVSDSSVIAAEYDQAAQSVREIHFFGSGWCSRIDFCIDLRSWHFWQFGSGQQACRAAAVHSPTEGLVGLPRVLEAICSWPCWQRN
jgi:hypothetical protein